MLAPTGKEPVPAQPGRLRESRQRWAEHAGPSRGPGPGPSPSSRRPPWAPRPPSVPRPRDGRGAQPRGDGGSWRGRIDPVENVGREDSERDLQPGRGSGRRG